jgi:hypothetical protein
MSSSSYVNTARKSYVALAAFNNDFFTYTTSFNDASFSYVGNLATFAPAGQCPKGRILRENGKKLFPDANPGVSTYMIGVYDPVSFLNGFIDPNSPIFTIVNSDKPNYLADGVDAGPGGLPHLAPPVYTHGQVLCKEVVATGQVRSSGVVTAGIASGSVYEINPNLGQVFKFICFGNCTFDIYTENDPNNLPGAMLSFIVTNATGSPITVHFRNGFIALSSGTKAISVGNTGTISFVSDGDRFYQIAEVNTVTP